MSAETQFKATPEVQYQEALTQLPNPTEAVAAFSYLPREDLLDILLGTFYEVSQALKSKDPLTAVQILNAWRAAGEATTATQPARRAWSDYQNDLSQLGELKRQLAAAPPEAFVSKTSIRHRIAELEQKTDTPPPAWQPQPRLTKVHSAVTNQPQASSRQADRI